MFTFNGLEDLKAALHTMPELLTEEATAIVTRRALREPERIYARYPTGPDEGGHLKGKTTVTVSDSRHGVIARVRNSAKTALSFEYGTHIRRNARSLNRGRGASGKHVFGHPLSGNGPQRMRN